jgi:hypothetical protein
MAGLWLRLDERRGSRQATSTIRRNLQIQETEGLFQLPPRAVANEMLLHVIEPFAAQTFYQPTYGPALSFAGQFKRTLDRARPFRESHLASDNGPSCCVRFFRDARSGWYCAWDRVCRCATGSVLRGDVSAGSAEHGRKYHSADWISKSPKRVAITYDHRSVVQQLYDLGCAHSKLGCVHSKNEFKKLAAHLVIVVHHLDVPVGLGEVNVGRGATIPASVVDQAERSISVQADGG